MFQEISATRHEVNETPKENEDVYVVLNNKQVRPATFRSGLFWIDNLNPIKREELKMWLSDDLELR